MCFPKCLCVVFGWWLNEEDTKIVVVTAVKLIYWALYLHHPLFTRKIELLVTNIKNKNAYKIIKWNNIVLAAVIFNLKSGGFSKTGKITFHIWQLMLNGTCIPNTKNKTQNTQINVKHKAIYRKIFPTTWKVQPIK